MEVHFEWNLHRPELKKDRIEGKHFEMAKRSLERGGRQDIFLGARDCQGYVEPCRFGETQEGAYDKLDELGFGLMFHGFDYPDETGIAELHTRFWHPTMKKGSVEIPGEKEIKAEQDKDLRKAWVSHVNSKIEEKGLCMATGEMVPITFNHPKYIRYPADGAKLISANDKKGFTFRGRFREASEACTIGYGSSQKAHNILRWLIDRQGYRNDGQVVVAWAVKGQKIPPLVEDDWMKPIEDDDFSGVQEVKAIPKSKPNTPDHTRDRGKTFAVHLKKAIAGYRGLLKPTDDIVILGLDAATKGRMSIVFYREIVWNDYLDRLERWQKNFAWPLLRTVEDKENKKKRTVVQVSAPTPIEICYAAYGGRADDQLKKATVERLLPCIADAAPIPRDLMACCIRRACNRVGLEWWDWETTLGVACALFKGFYERYPNKEQRRTYDMSLEPERTSRDYLFGRLLAVAERLEEIALYTLQRQ